MRISIIVALLLALSVTGCMESPADITATSTAAPPLLQTAATSHGFMPLTPGNHWSYDRELSMVVILDDGPPGPPETLSERVDLHQAHTMVFDDVEYILEQEHYRGSLVLLEWLRRQDRAGYYLLEAVGSGSKTVNRPTLSSTRSAFAGRVASKNGVARASIETLLGRIEDMHRALRGLDSPSASPPGGALPYELTTLAYPLHPGASWTIRDEPLFVATVEARDRYRGLSAWRVRIDSELLGENDVAHAWYSRCGYLGLRHHFEFAATDESGNPVGKVIGDEVVEIADLQIDRGGCDVTFDTDSGDGGTPGSGPLRSYPLWAGNRWTYEVNSIYVSLPPDHWTTGILETTQQAWITIDGHTYMKQFSQYTGERDWTAESFLRQDRDGLYQWETWSDPAGDEATVLDYPLEVGKSWTIRESPGIGPWTATVEARETVATEAGEFDAFRVRITHSDQGPEDKIEFWYAAEGLIKTRESYGVLDGPFVVTSVLTELDLVTDRTSAVRFRR